MAAFNPQARRTNRGNHPDINEVTGELEFDTWLYPDAEERDFNRRYTNDAQFRDNYLQRMAAFQRSLPEQVQVDVQGKEYGAGEGAYRGLAEYRHAVDVAMRNHAYIENADIVVTDAQIAEMSTDEYDRHFDMRGKPRDGVRVHYTRAVRLDDGRPR